MLNSLITSKIKLKSPLSGGLPAGKAGVAKRGFASLKLRESEGGLLPQTHKAMLDSLITSKTRLKSPLLGGDKGVGNYA